MCGQILTFDLVKMIIMIMIIMIKIRIMIIYNDSNNNTNNSNYTNNSNNNNNNKNNNKNNNDNDNLLTTVVRMSYAKDLIFSYLCSSVTVNPFHTLLPVLLCYSSRQMMITS